MREASLFSIAPASVARGGARIYDAVTAVLGDIAMKLGGGRLARLLLLGPLADSRFRGNERRQYF
jgi:hypothetical protein